MTPIELPCWLVAIISGGCFAVGHRVQSIRNEIEKNTRDLLWEQVDLAGVRIKRFLERDIESLLLSACAMIGQIKPFLHIKCGCMANSCRSWSSSGLYAPSIRSVLPLGKTKLKQLVSQLGRPASVYALLRRTH
jgi:hypothetical protein